MATITNPLTATPQAIDTELASLYDRLMSLESHRTSAKRQLDRHPTMAPVYEKQLAEVEAALVVVHAEIAPLVTEYYRRPWSRFFLVVTNGQGHVHRDRNCSTCFPTTRYGWLPALSGATETEAVAEYGEQMCTVCFPSAPSIAKTLGPSKAKVERDAARAVREAKRVEAAAKREAKTLRTTAGGILRDAHGYRIETVSAGWSEAVHMVEIVERHAYATGSITDQNIAKHHEAYRMVTEALAQKLGKTVDAIMIEARAKADRRAKAGR